MKSLTNSFRLQGAASLAAIALAFSTPALAQEEDADPYGSDTTETDAEDTSTTDDAYASDTEEEAAPAPEADEEEAEADEDEPAEASASASASVSLGGDSSAEGDAEAPAPRGGKDNPSAGFPSLDVVLLPGSAYPAIQTRGIVNGSLWRTFHGQQWPYLPAGDKGPGVRLGLSGYYWNDLSNTRITVDDSLADSNINDQNRWATQSRGVLRITPTLNAEGDWFVQGNAEVVIQGDMTPKNDTLATTDDLWVRAGLWGLFDVTVGRFQGWEIANHYGMALDLNTLERDGAVVPLLDGQPTDGYGLSYFWDRQDFRLGGYALHVYPTDYLRLEMLSHLGAGGAEVGIPYQYDVRPSAIFDIGWVKLKAGWEYGKARPQDAEAKTRDEKNGYGFAAQFVLDPYVEFGGSFARGFQDVLDITGQPNLEASKTVQTFGGFLNASPGHKPLVLGVGAFLNSEEDFRINQDPSAGRRFGEVDTNKQWLIFGAVQYTFFEKFNLKFVASHASNQVRHFDYGDYVNNAISGRLRAEVLF